MMSVSRSTTMRFIVLTAGILALYTSAFAQSATPSSTFDAADVHASPRGIKEGGLYLHANRLEMHGVTMLHLIATAYGVPEDKIFGGPNWLDTGRFEIIAKAETPVNTQTFQPMLKALL